MDPTPGAGVDRLVTAAHALHAHPGMRHARKVDMKIFVWALTAQTSLFALGLAWAYQGNAAVNERAAQAEAAVATTRARLDALIEGLNKADAIAAREIGTIQADLRWIRETLLARQSPAATGPRQ